MIIRQIRSHKVGAEIGWTNYGTIQEPDCWNIFTVHWVWVRGEEMSRRPGPESP